MEQAPRRGARSGLPRPLHDDDPVGQARRRSVPLGAAAVDVRDVARVPPSSSHPPRPRPDPAERAEHRHEGQRALVPPRERCAGHSTTTEDDADHARRCEDEPRAASRPRRGHALRESDARRRHALADAPRPVRGLRGRDRPRRLRGVRRGPRGAPSRGRSGTQRADAGRERYRRRFRKDYEATLHLAGLAARLLRRLHRRIVPTRSSSAAPSATSRRSAGSTRSTLISISSSHMAKSSAGGYDCQ